MATLSFDPLFKDERFLSAHPTVKSALVCLIHNCIDKKRFDIATDSDYQRFGIISHSAWIRHKTEVLDIFQDVLPLIMTLKRKKQLNNAPAIKAMREALKKKNESRRSQAREASQAQSAPLEPQKSAAAAKKKRQSIQNEAQFTNNPQFVPTDFKSEYRKAGSGPELEARQSPPQSYAPPAAPMVMRPMRTNPRNDRPAPLK